MKPRNTLIVAIVFIACAVAFYFLQVREGTRVLTSQERTEAAKRIIPGFTLDKATRLRIEHDDVTVLCEKAADGMWKVLEPIEINADLVEIDKLLDPITYLDKSDIDIEDNALLGDFGLESPAAKLTVWWDGKTETISLGSKTPVHEEDVYGQLLNEGNVFVVSNILLESFRNADLAHLRTKNLLHFTDALLSRCELRNPKETIILDRTGEGWRLVEPISSRADLETIKSFLNDLKDLRVASLGFVDDPSANPSIYGFDNPRASIILTEGDQTHTLLIGGDVPNKKHRLYATQKEAGFIYEVDAKVLPDLTRDTNSLRDRAVTRIDTNNIIKIEIDTADGRVLLQKDNYSWAMKSPEEIKAAEEEISSLLTDLTTLRVKRFVDDNPKNLRKYGLDSPAATLTFISDAGRSVSFSVGNKGFGDRYCFVQRASETAVLAIDADFLKYLEVPALKFRDKQVLNLSKFGLKKITLFHGKQEYVSTQQLGSKWRIAEPIDAPADGSILGEIAWGVLQARAENFVAGASADLKAFGLDQPRITATLELEQDDGMKTHTLMIGSEVKNGTGSYAKVAEYDFIFTISDEKVGHLEKTPISKDVAKFETSDAIRISATIDKVDIEIEKQLDDWEITKPTQAIVDKKDVDEVLAGIATLKADDFVEFSLKNARKYGLHNPTDSITVSLNGSKKRISLGKVTKGKRYATSSDIPAVFTVSKFQIQSLKKRILELAKHEE